MQTCLFLSFRGRSNGLDLSTEIARLDNMLVATRGLQKAVVHTPTRASDPFLDDGAPPQLVLQLYFVELSDLEAALVDSGPLSFLTSREAFPALASTEVSQQAMLVRSFTVPEPALNNASSCTYLVSYEGEAQDLNDWLAHYLVEHTRHMANLPSIRELEVYTRLDWVSRLAFARMNCMQRNKVVFDSAAALTHALNSPVRQQMREDYKTFPPFTGANTHYPMVSRVVQRPAEDSPQV
jgi:hypothetical protein